jgi:hypothetical protein
MRTPNDYIRIPALADPLRPTSMANFTWMLILTMAVIGATLTLSCVTPFAALAVALAGTVGLRASLRIVTIIWLANQIVGFVFFHFPHTANTFLWGIAIGGAALVTTIVASVVMKYTSDWATSLRLVITLVAAFGVYEMALLAVAVLLGGLESFRPAIVGQLALINVISLGGMIVLNEIVATVGKPWLGIMPRLVRSS